MQSKHILSLLGASVSSFVNTFFKEVMWWWNSISYCLSGCLETVVKGMYSVFMMWVWSFILGACSKMLQNDSQGIMPPYIQTLCSLHAYWIWTGLKIWPIEYNESESEKVVGSGLIRLTASALGFLAFLRRYAMKLGLVSSGKKGHFHREGNTVGLLTEEGEGPGNPSHSHHPAVDQTCEPLAMVRWVAGRKHVDMSSQCYRASRAQPRLQKRDQSRAVVWSY